MKRIDKYLLASCTGAWIGASIFFMGLYLVIHFFNQIGDLSQAVRNFRASGIPPLLGFIRYYALNIPFVLIEVAPFTILMGSMWAVQQMARRNELVPVLMGGISFRRLALPILLSGFLLALAFAGMREAVLPRLAPERLDVERIFAGKKEKLWSDLPPIQDGRGNVFLIQAYDAATATAHGVSIRQAGQPAAGGAFFPALKFVGFSKEDGRFEIVGAEGTVPLEIETDLLPEDIEMEVRQIFMPVGDARRMLRRYPDRARLELLLHEHYAYPLRTVVLLLLGFPLALKATRRSPHVAVGLSLLVSVGFFAVNNVLAELARRGELVNAVLGAWLPIILFGAVGILVFEMMPS